MILGRIIFKILSQSNVSTLILSIASETALRCDD